MPKGSWLRLVTLVVLSGMVISTSWGGYAPGCQKCSPVVERARKEAKILPDSFAIPFYKPTYILPYYYTGSPYKSVYDHHTPNNEGLKREEVKYQFSFKVPVWKNIFCTHTNLNFAYTQLSYWQAYNHKTFVREDDYEPELFLAHEVNYRMFGKWYLNFVNLGAVHQSNGDGNAMERSWNRLYLEAIASNNNWMVSVKPWYVFHDHTMEKDNPNITSYLGYGQLLVAYKYYRQVFAIQAHSLVECGGRRATAELTWSFPITGFINGYVDLFSGYGQSLIEYNHRTNSAGVGIAFNNWI